MCWSLEITLLAASLETLCCCVLVYRARRYDRPNALLILPLVLQEWLQVILWIHLGTSATDCDVINQNTSALVTYLVCGVPAWISLQPLMQGTTSGEEKRMVCYFFVLACICGLGGIMVQTFGQMGVGWMTSKCTYKGPWSHQIWPVLNMQYHLVPGILGSFLGKMLSAGNLLLYMISSLGGFLSSRPSYVLPTLAAIGLNAQFLILFLGPEWGSFWCFQASLLSCVALLEPYFFKTFGEINAFAPKKSEKQQPVDERSTTLGVELDALVDEDEQTSTIP